MNILSLYQLNSIVHDTIKSCMNDSYWVQAEVAEARERGGHCYIDLIERQDGSNTPIAHSSARCWRSSWAFIKQNFIHVTGQPLSPGMKILMEVSPEFHPAYGFSWIITDIDPSFTVGDMARKRQEILKQLTDEGVINLNKEQSLSPFANSIAVISSETAAGYGDFCNQLHDNAYGYTFSTKLFPAIMQGEMVETSVIDALGHIFRNIDKYDCVVIIRGGGASADMSGFDSLSLAEHVANFPLPVITGIGHERDECVLDIISHTRVKTPTAAASFLIDNIHRTNLHIDALASSLQTIVKGRLEREKLSLLSISATIPRLVSTIVSRQRISMENLENRLSNGVRSLFTNHNYRLSLIAQKLASANPELQLSRGYTITTSGGRVIRNLSDISKGDIIETRTSEGVIKSIVSDIEKN